jgi:hypothetical protein
MLDYTWHRTLTGQICWQIWEVQDGGRRRVVQRGYSMRQELAEAAAQAHIVAIEEDEQARGND